MAGRRWMVLLLALVLLAACSGGPTSDATGCPGFYLRGINQSSRRINVDINVTPIVVLEPNDSKVIGQFLPPQPPDLPWRVDVRRSTTGAEIGDATFVGGPNRDLVVKDGGIDEQQFSPPQPTC